MNTSNAPTDSKLTLELTRLEMKTVSEVTDVLSGEKLKLEGKVLTVSQPAHGGRVIWLKP